MSDDEQHVEPIDPPADEFATRLFLVSISGVLAFIAVVFIFII